MSRRLAAVVATTTGAAVLFAAPVAVADPEIMPDQYQQFTTDDGWVVNLTITDSAGARIAAQSGVMRDVAPGASVGGTPARSSVSAGWKARGSQSLSVLF